MNYRLYYIVQLWKKVRGRIKVSTFEDERGKVGIQG